MEVLENSCSEKFGKIPSEAHEVWNMVLQYRTEKEQVLPWGFCEIF